MSIALLLVLALATDALAALAPGDHLNQSFVFDGATRLYDVHVPLSYDGSTPVPLVLDFHGYSSNKFQQAAISGMKARADAAGFIVVHPQGLFGQPDDPEAVNLPDGPSWNAGICCGKAVTTQVDDVGFVRTLVEALAAEGNIDRTRVYATGLSNGGAMSQALACNAADLFAAAAPLAFPIPFDPPTACQPSRPIPVMNFMGLTDALVPYDGNGFTISAAASFAQWRANDGCGSDSVEETVVTGTSRCETDTSCAAGVEVALCSINSTFPPPFAGHVLYVNPDLVLADVAWDFLSRFSLPSTPPPLPTRVGNAKLLVKDGADPSKRKLLFLSKDPAVGTDIDPTVDGASLRLYNTNGTGESVCLDLPAGGWQAAGGGFAYRDATFANGPCATVKVKRGKLLKVLCRAKVQAIAYSLDEPAQGSLGVRFTSGTTTYCAGFGGTIARDAGTAAGEPGIFRAKNDAVPAVCPVPRVSCP